jgi:hypothetical protein
MNFAGAVLLTQPDTKDRAARKRLTKLIRVGHRLAVLGVEDGPAAMGWWHVAVPGTWNTPQGLSGTACEGDDLAYATSLCRRRIATNGYAADWRPPDGVLCPSCREQI